MRSGIVRVATLATQVFGCATTVALLSHPAQAKPPAAPTRVSAAGTSATSLQLRWQDNSRGELGFEVEFTTDGSAWRAAGSAPANATSFTLSGLSASTRYGCRVRAYTLRERSSFSAAAWGTTLTPPLGAPTSLSAAGSSLTTVDLSWSDNAQGEEGYEVQISQDGSNWRPAGTAGADATRFTVSGLLSGTQYGSRVRAFSGVNRSAFSSVAWAGTLAGPPPPPPPPAPSLPAPSGLTANGLWTDNCSVCGGPKAYVELAWQPVAGAASYNLYRDGEKVLTGRTAPEYKDMGVTSGRSYTYSVAAVGGDGREGARSAGATALAPNPPSGGNGEGGLLAPINLRVAGQWTSAGPSDVLTWDPVPGAKTYNVYRYDDVMATGVPSPTYTITASRFRPALTYTVTAVGEDGKESLPSALSSAQGAYNPNSLPGWAPPVPRTPFDLTAKAEWNAGRPRVVVGWRGGQYSFFYNVYRDGVQIASNVWGLYYIDTKVAPGESHVYSVSAINANGLEIRESVRSGSVVGTALNAAPTGGGLVKVTGVRSNDDSAMIFFDAVPGAADYRIYDPAKPTVVKYSGGNTSVEWNGMNPALGATLVVEALDKLGPYQKMDGEMGPGSMDHATGAVRAEINGQGDPSNVPIVLAKSAPFAVTCRARTMDGEQVFFDTFRNQAPFVSAPVPPALWEANRNNVGAVQNDKWLIYNVLGDLLTSRVFTMSGHFMDTLYDGGTPGTNEPLHQNNAAILMQPKQYADISDGKVLHVTFEVDSHFNGRRWCDVIIAGADDPLVNPGKFWETNMMPTVSGNVFRWEILARHHTAQRFLGKNAEGQIVGVPLFDQTSGVGPDSFGLPARTTWDNIPTWNGTSKDLDRRHRFDLYLSRDRFQVWEEGTLIKDKQMPAGTELPFTKAAIYFLHAAYHTDLDRQELVEYTTANYWIHHRPYADERHWDNMGFSVVSGFPTTLQH